MTLPFCLITSFPGLSTPCCQSPLLSQVCELRCQACGAVYPYLNEDIAILVPKPMLHLTQTTMALKKELQTKIERLLQLKKYIKINPGLRTEHLTQLQHAYEHNTRLLSSMISTIPMTASTPSRDEDCLSASYNRLDTCLSYLRRDWGSNTPAQEEITAIGSRVMQLLKTYCDSPQKALFLGAGLGRFAYDLSPFFENTLAIDHSMMMGYFYHKIKRQHIDFYHIKLKNAEHNAQQYELIHTSMQHAARNNTAPRALSYAIADARCLPLANQTVSAIISIYFTDVLPWSQLWPEVMRVLKPGGVFIHYGPLQYHFKTLHEHYSADDLRAELQYQGFELHDEQWDAQGHLAQSLTNGKAYNNWSFAAIRQD